MSDTLGRITVPDPAVSATPFPLVTSFGYSIQKPQEVAVHQFVTGNAKMEQRYLLGNGAKTFTFQRGKIGNAQRIALRDFWEDCQGGYQAFPYDAPAEDQSTTTYIVRFENAPLTLQHLTDAITSVGVDFVECPDLAAGYTPPSYTITETLTRFPSAALKLALLAQAQQIIPLIRIRVTEAAVADIFVSDRRVTIGAQLYLPRLLDWAGITQAMSTESDGADDAQFTFGNADRAMLALANDTDLFKARIEFSLFHVEGTAGRKLNLWAGDAITWTADAGPEFVITASDGPYELTLDYPPRLTSRTCWKDFDDGVNCPASSSGGTNLGVACDKGFATAAGCQYHNMDAFFGSQISEPQAVRTKDNSTGLWGLGRASITTTSQIADTLYGQALAEIWHHDDGDPKKSLPVSCLIATGREEGDFYDALCVVGAGPIGAYTTPQMVAFDPLQPTATTYVGPLLDGQPHHGFRLDQGTDSGLGLRTIRGTDPAGATDWYSLGQGNPQVYDAILAAGTAFMEIRRSDQKGVQVSQVTEHTAQAAISQGLQGWTWTAPGTRVALSYGLTKPVFIAVNSILRAVGVFRASTAVQESLFDTASAIAAQAICDTSVTPLIGTAGSELQFRFKGVVSARKPLRDWMQDILNNCLGYWTNSFGKIRFGLRTNATAVEAFTTGNILFQSLTLAPLDFNFNHLTIQFADEDYGYQGNTGEIYDIDHAKRIGTSGNPKYIKSSMNLAGSFTKSQTARIGTIRLREELGGISDAERKAARKVGFRTTVLSLNVEPGMACSLTHPDMPAGVGNFRVTRWTLNKDYSIDIAGRTVFPSIYDVSVGTTPVDIPPVPIPPTGPRDNGVPTACTFDAALSPVSPGSITISNVDFTPSGSNLRSLTQIVFTVYGVLYSKLDDPTVDIQTPLTSALNNSSTTIPMNFTDFPVGSAFMIDHELFIVTSSGHATRGALDSTAVSHSSGAIAYLLTAASATATFPQDFFYNDPHPIWSWIFPVDLAGQRIVAVSAVPVNLFGAGPETDNCYTGLPNGGIDVPVPGNIVELNTLPPGGSSAVLTLPNPSRAIAFELYVQSNSHYQVTGHGGAILVENLPGDSGIGVRNNDSEYQVGSSAEADFTITAMFTGPASPGYLRITYVPAS